MAVQKQELIQTTKERTSTERNLQQARGKLSLEVSKCQALN